VGTTLAARVHLERSQRDGRAVPRPSARRQGSSPPGLAPDVADPEDRLGTEGKGMATPTDPRAVHAAEIYCETCGGPTNHRILRLDPPRRGAGPGVLQGIARCRNCRTTHRFRSEPPRLSTLTLVRAEGPRSTRGTLQVPASTELRVGEEVENLEEPLRVLRLDRADGASVEYARADQVSTVWATADLVPRIPVSIVEGRRTRSVRLQLPPDARLAVDSPIEVEGRPYVVSALRARGHTWRRPGDEFPSGEVTRLYVRRSAMPPAGSMPWRRERASPSSSARATSSSGRRRSSPGTRTTRTRPRA